MIPVEFWTILLQEIAKNKANKFNLLKELFKIGEFEKEEFIPQETDFQGIGCSLSTDHDIVVFVPEDIYNNYRKGVVVIDLYKIFNYCFYIGCDPNNLDITLVVLKEDRGKIIVKQCCSLEGSEKYSSITNNVIYHTFNSNRQKRSTSKVNSPVTLDCDKMSNNLTKFVLGIFYKEVTNKFLTKEEKQNLIELKHKHYEQNPFIVISALLEHILVHYDKINPSLLKTMMMRLIQVVLYNKFNDEAYQKELLAEKAARYLLPNEANAQEGFLYDLFRRKRGNKFSDNVYRQLISMVAIEHELLKISFENANINLCVGNVGDAIPHPAFTNEIVVQILKILFFLLQIYFIPLIH